MTTEISRSALTLRPDFATIAAWIRPGSSVLDLGCGDGTLLHYLRDKLDIHGYGVEIDAHNILACMKNGINVIQNDLEAGLSEFEGESFDYVILSQTLQAMKIRNTSFGKCYAWAKKGSFPFPISATGKTVYRLPAGTCPSRQLCLTSGMTPRTYTFAPCTTSSSYVSSTGSTFWKDG